MATTTFRRYGNPEKRIQTPNWDGPYEPQKKWGKLANNIPEISKLIRQAAKVFRENIPKSKNEIVSLEQPAGILEIDIRGGVRFHSDCDMWVTEKTLPLTMKIICSIRKLKPQIEKLTSQERARDLYHNVVNALRYVFEPKDPDIEGHLAKTSGNEVLSGYLVSSPATAAKNVFRQVGYVFVGDEPRKKHKSFVDEILFMLEKRKESEKTEIFRKAVVLLERLKEFVHQKSEPARQARREAFSFLVEHLGLLNEAKRKYGIHGPLEEPLKQLEYLANRSLTKDLGTYVTLDRDITQPKLSDKERFSFIDQLNLWANKIDKETEPEPTGTGENARSAKEPSKKRGRPKKHTSDKLDGMQRLYDELYRKTPDSKAAWNHVAKIFDVKSGDAARIACLKHQQKLK